MMREHGAHRSSSALDRSERWIGESVGSVRALDRTERCIGQSVASDTATGLESSQRYSSFSRTSRSGAYGPSPSAAHTPSSAPRSSTGQWSGATSSSYGAVPVSR
eukprot:6280709-Prymnesium_polylepis.1